MPVVAGEPSTKVPGTFSIVDTQEPPRTREKTRTAKAAESTTNFD
jgi:hypothetical protein